MAGVYGNMMAIPRNGRGGALPTYQGDGRVYTPGTGVSARLSDSAAGIYRQTAQQTGQGLRDLARGIDTANRIGMAAYEDYNKTKATQLMVEYRTRVNDAMYGDNGLMTRKGEDAFQTDRELERRSQQIREEVLKDYRGSLAENLFNMRVREFDAENLLRAKKHKRDEYDAWSNRADDAAADMFANEAAANYGSPEAYSRSAAQAAWHIRQMLERKGYPPEAIDQALKQTQKGIYDKAMKQAISLGDFDGAERLLGGTAASLPADVAELAKREAKAQGIDPALVMGVIAQESGGRHGVVSSAGARGLMQLMPGTAKDLGVDPDDPAQNVRAGVSYLKQMLQRYNGNVEHALAAYNWGPGNVDAWLKTGKGVKGQVMPEETRKYVPGVLAKMGMDGGVSSVEKQAYRKQIDEGRRRLAAEARVDIASRIQDASAAWKQGLDAPNAPTQAEIRAAYEPVTAERIWREVQAGMQFGEDMKSLGTMTGEQQMQLLERRKPSPDNAGYADQMQRYALLQQAVRQDNELRQKDPAAYLLTREPEVKQALDAFTAAPTYENAQAYVKAVRAGQEARGMSFDSTSPVLPASTATAMAQSILKSPDPVGQLQTLQSAFGISAWPAVERQLVRGNKLPGALRVAAGGMNTESGRLLMDTYKNKDFMKQATAMFDVKEADIKRDIRGEMEDFLESVNAQGDLQMGDTLVESATRLAFVYMQQGYSLKDARVKAAQEVGVDRYTFKGSYRVPMQYDADTIESGASRVLNEVTSGGQLALPETRGVTDSYTRERTNAAIMQDGTWVTLPDESGLGLYVLGSPVLDKDGKHVTRTWAQLTAAIDTFTQAAEWYDRYVKFKNSDWKPTKLSASEEKEFKSWLMNSRWFTELKTDIENSGEKISAEDLYNDVTGPRSDYDYRGAWKAGVMAQDYEFDTRMHWPSASPEGKILKAPNHPTAWMEFFMEETGVDPNSLGLRNAEEARAYTKKRRLQADSIDAGDTFAQAFAGALTRSWQ